MFNHSLEKRRSAAARSGSFIACAEVFGNGDHATEGGIPRSSRFRWFAQLPCFMRECPKARSDWSGFRGI